MKKIFLLLLLFLLIASQGYAFTYSLANDWSDLINPNGTWSYNAGNNPLPSSVAGWPLNEFGGSQRAWANGNVLHDTLIPAWFKSVANNPGGNDWLMGDVIVHSADLLGTQKYGLANVTWTSPATGIYDIYGGLWAGRDIERSNDWTLYLDDVLLTNGSLFTGDSFSRANPNTFNFNGVNIAQGSILKLEVVRVAAGDDFVGVDLNINDSAVSESTVPEPTTMLLFGSGLVGAYLRKRRI